MPKNRKTTKVDGAIKVSNVPNKLRIGTRSSGTSATLMSTKKLQDVITDTNYKRYWNNAITVLNRRGVTVVPA